MNVLDLFSGIGGFSLGLERAGMRTVAFCEIDPYCRRVLAKHWPGVPCYEDVRELTGQRLWDDGNTVSIQVICGGFPCQDISVAGKGAGIDGDRSGLWSEYARIVGDLRPQWVIVENVAALLARGLDRVLGDLAALGYDAEWHCIPASAVGAPHRRDRVWIVAYPNGDGQQWSSQSDEWSPAGIKASRRDNAERLHPAMADADRRGRREQGDVGETTRHQAPGQSGNSGEVCFAGGTRLAIGPRTLRERAHAATTGTGWWATEPDVGRVVDGPASRVDRRKRLITLGNGVVPDIPEIIGRAIMRANSTALKGT